MGCCQKKLKWLKAYFLWELEPEPAKKKPEPIKTDRLRNTGFVTGAGAAVTKMRGPGAASQHLTFELLSVDHHV